MSSQSATTALDARLDALRGTPAYQAYLTAREHVLAMLDAQAETAEGDPSAYWSEELEGFEYLLDASPLIVDKLRHHSYHVTGLKPYDYRTGKDAAGELMAEKLASAARARRPLAAGPEPRDLGGFGHEIDGALYNIDTLKYFEVLIALERGAVLPGLRDGRERRSSGRSAPAGAGSPTPSSPSCRTRPMWSSDLPQLFLFSGTYLQTVLPDARIAWLHDQTEVAAFAAWDDYDVVFTPHFALDALRPPHLELAMNTVSFQEMTSAQVRGLLRTRARARSALPLQPQP